MQLIKLGYSKADPNLCIRNAGDNYEYIAVYFNDVLIFDKQAVAILRDLEILFQMKDIWKPEFDLSGDIIVLRGEDEELLTF